MNEIKINHTYDTGGNHIVRVLDVTVKGGRCVIKCQRVYGDDPEPFFVGPEDTKHWEAG